MLILYFSKQPMRRLLYSGPGFKYCIFWRRKMSTYWNKNIVENPMADTWEVDVNDTFKQYEVKVKAMNQYGESRQPAFIYTGYSGEGGKNLRDVFYNRHAALLLPVHPWLRPFVHLSTPRRIHDHWTHLVSDFYFSLKVINSQPNLLLYPWNLLSEGLEKKNCM